MAVINLGSLTDLEKVDYVREGLPVAKPKLIYSQFAVKDRVAKREGKTRQWFKLAKIGITSGDDFTGAATYVKNSTGAAPTWTPQTPTDTTITAQVDFLFGKGHEWNEGVEYTSFADLPKELRLLNTLHAAEAIDTEVKSVVSAGTNVAYANARATRPALLSTDQIDMNDIFDAVTTLRNNDAPEINGMYSVLCSANVIAQLMKDTAFQAAIVSQKPYIFTGTIVELYNCRFLFSSLAATTSDAGSASQIATVEQTIITGDNAYGKTAWMLDDYDIIYTSPGGWGDEWKNRHALTWKFAFKSLILNQNWLLRLESSRA